MDAGKFESSSQPFQFHRAINALVASLKVATTAKKLGLHVSLDERIDQLPQSLEWQGSRATFVVGDEIRLRQVLTNLASNAVKFSREGAGAITVVTKLIWPESGSAEMLRYKGNPAVPPQSAGNWAPEDVTPFNPDEKETSLAMKNEDEASPMESYIPHLSHDIEKEAGTVLLKPLLHSTDSAGTTETEKQEKLAKRQCVIVRIEITDTGPG